MTRRRPTNAIYQLKVTLKGVKPPVWRRLQVSGNATLAELHDIIQTAMGWANCHLYEFEVGRDYYGEPDADDAGIGVEMRDAGQTRLGQVVKGERDKLNYTYDFGDNWQHEVLVEKILAAEEGRQYPVCVNGRQACPPEDCGGVWGYASFLEAIRDPNHEEHREMLEWVGGEFDPAAFDVVEVNGLLRHNE